MRIGVPPDGSKLVIATQHGLLFVVHNVDLATFRDDMKDLDFDRLYSVFFSVGLSDPSILIRRMSESESSESENDEGPVEGANEFSLPLGEPPIDFEDHFREEVPYFAPFAPNHIRTGSREPEDSTSESDDEEERDLSELEDLRELAARVFTRSRNRIEFLPQEHLRKGATMSIHFDASSRFMLTRRYCFGAEETLVYDLSTTRSPEILSSFNDRYYKWVRQIHLSEASAAAESIWGASDSFLATKLMANPGFSENDEIVEEYSPHEGQGSDPTTFSLAQSPEFEGLVEYPDPASIMGTQTNFMKMTRQTYQRFTQMIFERQLVHIPESNFSEGFFKSPCFSNCGRFVCSPYHRGVRMFDVEKMTLGLPFAATLWRPIINTHKSNVLVVAYSPTLPVMASGGLDGVVCMYSTAGS